MVSKRITCVLITVFLFVLSVANASGLFPGMDEMFGTSMPSVGLAIGRQANEQTETDNGSQETYLNFTGEDYLAFGQYLAGIGAKITDYNVENSTMTATISARDASMIFSYNWEEKTATAIYSSGTRAEMEKESIEPGDSILPPVGGVMPSAEFAINRKPDEQQTGDDGLIQTWESFGDEDYAAFSAYLAETGAVLENSSIDAGVMNAEIGLNGFAFQFIYNWNAQTASVIYPEGTTPESSRWNAPVGSGSILPEISDIGKELPRISMALKREPSSTEMQDDGSLLETYLDFSEADYNAFSQYLQKTGCSLIDYYTDDNGILVINLTNGSGKMTFSYDAVHHTGTATYPGQTRVEKAWAVTPTLEPKATPKPTEKTVTLNYSESECWYKAEAYFKNLRWKNPKSLVIYSHTTSYDAGSYTFTIDYSAENGFGGTNREYYWITVSATTGRVTLAFGSD